MKLAKKSDLTQNSNWRRITLMSILAKVLGRVIIRRVTINDGVDAQVTEQAGFKSTVQRCVVIDGSGSVSGFK